MSIVVESIGNEESINTITILKARLTRLTNSVNHRIIKEDSKIIELNQITYSILELLLYLKNYNLNSSAPKQLVGDKHLTEEKIFKIAKAACIIKTAKSKRSLNKSH